MTVQAHAQPRRGPISEDLGSDARNDYELSCCAGPLLFRRIDGFSLMITYTFLGREHLRSSSEILSREYFCKAAPGFGVSSLSAVPRSVTVTLAFGITAPR